MIHISGQHKIVLAVDEPEKLVVNRLRRIHIAVDIDIPAPVRPVFFQGFKGIEAAGIHIGKPVLFDEIAEKFFKAFAGIGKAGRGRKSGSCADHNCIGCFNFIFEFFYLL